jgi:lysophospholipase L1-like esterase
MISQNGVPQLNLTYRADDVDAVIPEAATLEGRKFILTILIGANDLEPVYSGNTTNFLNALWAYTNARRAAGWTVGVATILPKGSAQSGYATHNSARATVNAAILAAVGTECDFSIDFAGDATMGPDAAGNNVALYSDGLHPTATAHETYLEPIYRAAVNAI